MDKKTYSEALDVAISTEGIPEDVKARLTDLKNALAKRNASKSKKTNAEGAKICNAILDVLADGAKTVTEMINASDVLAGMSTQKVSPYANRLVADGKLDKFTDKKATYFRLVSDEVAEGEVEGE